MEPSQIYDAARTGDVKTVKACIEAGADPAQKNEFGFTALHCAAMGANKTNVPDNIAIIKMLLYAGSPLEVAGKGGRTALFLAAEFSPTVDAIKLLLDAGAKSDISDEHGNHIVENAMMPEVKEILSKVTGKTISAPPPPLPKPIKMSAADWRKAKERIDVIFDQLFKSGLVALQDSGTTQDDGFFDCSEVFQEEGGEKAGLHGFCFYTRQDLNRAKKTSQLSLAFWGAPEGGDKDMERVGKIVVTAFIDAGFEVDWDGTSSMRPTVFLKK